MLSPMTRRRLLGLALLAAGLAAALLLARHPTRPLARGWNVVTGRRDEATREAIAATRDVALPRHADTPLRLVVTKSRRRLDVLAGETTLRTFPVALGGEPAGPKRREGDRRTPEGDYVLVPGHPSPGFGPCFYVCYPNEQDAERGRRDGVLGADEVELVRRALAAGDLPPHETALGGLILLHGTRDRRRRLLTASDWTNGCIAMENADLDELLACFAPGDRPVLRIEP